MKTDVTNEIRVLLCCGAGMSSGFLAQKTRAVAKKEGLKINIEARSQSDVGEFVNQVHIVLIGPHYENVLAEITSIYRSCNTPVIMIPQKIYGSLDGDGLLKLIKETLKIE